MDAISPISSFSSLSSDTVISRDDTTVPRVKGPYRSNTRCVGSLNTCNIATENNDKKLDPRHNQGTGWLPYTLRRWFLAIYVALSLAFAAAVTALYERSDANQGLGGDDGSVMVLLGWRFTPTLVAVLYVQLSSIMLQDAKRTEPFARLSRSGKSDASSTILHAPGAWWAALIEGGSKSKADGRRSWFLFCAALLNIIGFLGISPISSSLLISKEVSVPRPTEFLQMTSPENSSIPLYVGRETIFRTLGHLLQDITTSAWITDNYTVIPFWPSYVDTVPLGPTLSGNQQVWEAEAQVLSMEFSCNDMPIVSAVVTQPPNSDEGDNSSSQDDSFSDPDDDSSSSLLENRQDEDSSEEGPDSSGQDDDQGDRSIDQDDNSDSTGQDDGSDSSDLGDDSSSFVENRTSVLLESKGGCTVGLSTTTDERTGSYVLPPFSTWSNFSYLITPNWDQTDYGLEFNSTSQCEGNLILVSNHWSHQFTPSGNSGHGTPSLSTTLAALECMPSYYMASIKVKASISSSSTDIYFDEGEYLQRRASIPPSFFNTAEIENFVLASNWTDYLLPVDSNITYYDAAGLSSILAAQCSWNLSAVAANPSLASQAAMIRKRFFGEALLSSLGHANTVLRSPVSGTVTVIERRIVVVKAAAVALGTLLWTSAVLSSAMLCLSITRRRKLNLAGDPAILGVVASLVTRNDSLLSSFRGLYEASNMEVKQELEGNLYWSTTNVLHELKHRNQAFQASKLRHSHVFSSSNTNAS